MASKKPSKQKRTVATRIAKDKEKVLEELRNTPVIHVAVTKVGIGRTTFYRWRNKDKKFAKAVTEAIAEGTAFINDMAETQLITLIKEKRLDAIRYWLSHRHASYAAKLEIQGNIQHEHTELTKEQKQVVRKALRLASLNKTNHGSTTKPQQRDREDHQETDQ